MNNHIIRLDDEVKKKIAAGEVIEGPGSVVKELLENCLDAGASRITVAIEEGGMKKIVVTDDGSGIYREDLPLAVEEHATSKIASINDIFEIASYGFRGEALSSISSVAKLTILSRHINEEEGAKLTAQGGAVDIVPYSGPGGTHIVVENLFYSVPARKKFLKSSSVQVRQIRDIVNHAALVNPEVAFVLEIDGKKQFNYPSAEDMDRRFKDVYGKDLLGACYFEEMSDLKVTIKGYLSRPGHLRSSRRWQQVYINGRPVDYPYLGFHLSRVYEAVARKGEHPVAVIFITIDPALLDVNIHPSKREVKLFDQRYIDQLIFSLGSKALDREHRIDSTTKGFSQEPFSEENQKVFPEEPFYRPPSTPEPMDIQGTMVMERGTGNLSDVLPLSTPVQYSEEKEMAYLGTLFSTFILAEKGDDLVIVDFHAAHERFLFDMLMTREAGEESQELLYPETVELAKDDYLLVLEEIDTLAEMGLMVEDFSDSTILIRALPGGVSMGREILFDFIAETREGTFSRTERREAAAATVACHSARRKGDYISQGEAEVLLEKVFSGDYDLRCPHGRPFTFLLGRDDLEKMVRRQ